jgi:hypothetical protein
MTASIYIRFYSSLYVLFIYGLFNYIISTSVCIASNYRFINNGQIKRDSSVGITTGYGLENRSLIPGRGKIFFFFAASRPALVPTQVPLLWVPGALSLGGKAVGE